MSIGCARTRAIYTVEVIGSILPMIKHAHIAINLYTLQKCAREKTEITEGHGITPSNQLFTYAIQHKRVTYKTVASYIRTILLGAVVILDTL